MTRRAFAKEICVELTTPHIQGRQKLPNLSRNLKRNIEDVVGPSTSEAQNVIEEAGTRKVKAAFPRTVVSRLATRQFDSPPPHHNTGVRYSQSAEVSSRSYFYFSTLSHFVNCAFKPDCQLEEQRDFNSIYSAEDGS
ncbi:hypothetical protein J6590_029824 [Homalodisca vitripennis]|nr:hypothetical protein J6590_029824 [Homalodisca vitripennis]